VWREELEDLVCDVTWAIVTVILRVLELIVVTTSEEPINQFTSPNSRLSDNIIFHLLSMKITRKVQN
jgi:hypothetical protein